MMEWFFCKQKADSERYCTPESASDFIKNLIRVYLFCSFAQLSFSETVRLKIRLYCVESGSTLK